MLPKVLILLHAQQGTLLRAWETPFFPDPGTDTAYDSLLATGKIWGTESLLMLAGTHKHVGANNVHGLYCAFPEAKLSNILGITYYSELLNLVFCQWQSCKVEEQQPWRFLCRVKAKVQQSCDLLVLQLVLPGLLSNISLQLSCILASSPICLNN